MYCIKCGVKLADAPDPCPLCGTVPYHPELTCQKAEHLYPQDRYPVQQLSPRGALIVVTAVLFLLPTVITLLCNWRLDGAVTWSGYVVGGLAVLYVPFVLPYWFKKPNPVIFVPCGFLAAGLFLLYISLATGGGWFLSFAFPVTGAVGLICTAVVTLLRYVAGGRLYIFGGAILALGAFLPVMELLLNLTFGIEGYIGWSFYPLGALAVLGGMLIFLAIYRPARETVERKFFL